MSTNNFSYDNILVVLPDFCLYDDRGGFIEYDNFLFDEYIADMQSRLSKIGLYSVNKNDNNRNYAGKIISEYLLEDTSHYNMGNVYIEVVIRSGYYSGENIDYYIDGDFYVENEESKMQSKIYQSLHKKIDNKCKQIENILKKHGGEQYIKTAQFSNGEAMYQKLSFNK